MSDESQDAKENAKTEQEQAQEKKPEQKPEQSQEQRSESRSPREERGERSGERSDRGGDRGERSGERGERGDRQSRPRGRVYFRKKVDKIKTQNLTIDYKHPEILKRFVTENGKILPRRITGTSAKNQRRLVREIKRARHLGMLPMG